MRNPLKFAGVPQTGKLISAISGSTFAILWGNVENVLYFGVLVFQRAACSTFQTCILYSQFRTKATPCVEVWQISNPRRQRLGEEKKKKIEETTGQKYHLPYSIFIHSFIHSYRGHNKTPHNRACKVCWQEDHAQFADSGSSRNSSQSIHTILAVKCHYFVSL